MQDRANELPPSATHPWVVLCGLAGFVVGLLLLYQLRPFAAIAHDGLLLIACIALGIALPDLLWKKVWGYRSAGLLRAPANGSWRRTMVKFVGLLASFGFVGLFYWLFPEYTLSASFYRPFFDLLRVLIPCLLVLAIPYFYLVDRRMEQPNDGLWQLGSLVLLQRRPEVELRVVGQHLLGWLVKGFFLPLMFGYLCLDTLKLYHYDFTRITNFSATWELLFFFVFYVDVVFGTMGYLMTLRVMDTHIRSTEPTLLGWVVAVICYEPFWNLVGRHYLNYEDGLSWATWLSGQPLLHGVWGVAILLLSGIYVWATVIFGARFSNLTHRGIITAGPYRLTKHPAFIAKNLSWWLIAVPFVVSVSAVDSIKCCLALLLVNGIYYLRAKTEERHLRRDPDYVRYAQWIDAHGGLRFVNRLPLIGSLARYRLPDLPR